MKALRIAVVVGVVGVLAGCRKAASPREFRVGYLPNLTHAQVLVGLQTGEFRKALTGVDLKVRAFNAGPSIIEAMFADEIDLAYIGPGPAMNGFVKSHGAVRIVAGSAAGGSLLVVRGDANIVRPEDFRGKRLCTPQLGNTQDIMARAWLVQNGLKPQERGGDVKVLPVANADQMTLFLKKEVDAAWAVEPWATLLVRNAGARAFREEKDILPEGMTSTVVVANARALRERPDDIKAWLKVHVELTRWVREHPEEARRLVNQEIQRVTLKGIPEEVLRQAWGRVHFETEPAPRSLEWLAEHARKNGFMRVDELRDLSALYDLTYLKEVSGP